MPPPVDLKCPVCAVRFRGNRQCPRCGTDLSAVMRLAARAWAARQRCRQALSSGELATAIRLAAVAREYQR